MKLLRTLLAAAVGALLPMATLPAMAATVAGNYGTLATVTGFTCVTEGCDTVADAFSALGTLAIQASAGGAGLDAAAVNTGNASGNVSLAGGLAVPLLKAHAISSSLQWLGGQAMGIQAYTYSGGGETLTLDWSLTGNITNPDGDGSTGLAMFAAFVDASALGAFPDLSDPLAVAVQMALLADNLATDDVREFTSGSGQLGTGTISIDVTDGQTFYLLMGLMAGAGGDGAKAESLSTFAAQFGAFDGSLAPLLTPGASVPLPASGALAMLALLLLPAARRRTC